jgi:hypothetical protein
VGLARTENAARPASDSARPVGVSAKWPAPTHSVEASCDDDQFLRNEAIRFVRGPLSVVRCEVETSAGPGVVSPARKEDPAHEPIPASAAVLRAGTSEAFREGEPPCEPIAFAGSDKSSTSADRHARKTRTQGIPETSNAERNLDAIINAIFDAHRPREPKS